MSNLSIENLSKTIQTGDAQGLFDGAPASDLRVNREMSANGMEMPSSGGGATFSDLLRESVSKVNEQQLQADTAIKELVAGRSKNIHETMLTIERADTSLKLAMNVRNKILDAYREIMRMQV